MLRTVPLHALALALALPVTATAQTQTGTDAPPFDEPVVVSEHQDWQVICTRVRLSETDEDTFCEMYQLMREATGQPIAEISIAALALGGEIVAGATITTPLETFLPTGLGFRIGAEAEQMRIEPFRVCTALGCIVRMGLSPVELRAMQAGSEAFVTIAPFLAIDQPIDIAVSLRGFTAAYQDLRARTPNPPAIEMIGGGPAPAPEPALPAGPLRIDPSLIPPTPPAARP